MTHYISLPAAHRFGVFVVLVAIALAGCDRNTGSVGKSPVAYTSGQSAEYPVVTPAPDSASTPATASLKVTVSLSPAVAKQAAPNDVVFIFARAAHGPRMPLAIVRIQVKDLPITVVLDDNLSMSSEMKLSSVPEVVVVARVSKSGMAGAQAGDLEGMSAPVKSGNHAIAINIANVVAGK